MLKILTVLKTGEDKEGKALKTHGTRWTVDHVYKIKRMCEKYISKEFEFYCLTNEKEINCNSIPIENNWQGWWSKLELFKIKGPVLYLDLDVVIIKNIDTMLDKLKNINFATTSNIPHMTIESQFDTTAQNFKILEKWHPRYFLPRSRGVQASFMYWSNDVSCLYKRVHELSLSEVISKMISVQGDQNIVSFLLTEQPLDFWTPISMHPSIKNQEIVGFKGSLKRPDQGYKYWYNTNDQERINNIKIVIFHGRPRPWEQDIIPY